MAAVPQLEPEEPMPRGRALDGLAFAGGSLQTDVQTICTLFTARTPVSSRRS